jgi:antitoxin VapB
VSLNLKNPKAHELATELADLTGESLTTAVILALEERLRNERRKREKQKSTSARILEFSRRFSAGLPAKLKSEDHGALLYGEDGLPR